MKTIEEKLSLVSTDCGVGVKQNSKGNREVWIGGKLHISAIDGDIPITAFYSGANVHDSSVALPLMEETSNRVNYLYDLQDAGYDADIIREFSENLGHRPIIDINPKNSKALKEKIELIKHEKESFKFINQHQSLDKEHYTHSVTFAFCVGLGALVFRKFFFKKSLKNLPWYLFFMASFSHLVLDFFVGVHGNPYLYPFTSSLIVSPLGILPSSGRMDIHNYYFWRNMLLEIAIFLPLILVFIPKIRAYVFRYKLLVLLIGLVFIVGIFVGLGLDRS